MSLQLGPSQKKQEGSAISFIQKSDYDADNDILYIKFASTKASFGDEVVDGIVILRDLFSDEITGLTIFYPKTKSAQRARELKELGFPLDLNMLVS